jgi:hypothetical protein
MREEMEKKFQQIISKIDTGRLRWSSLLDIDEAWILNY